MARKFRGELFTLIPPRSPCYPYDVHNCHHAAHSPAIPKIARPQLPTKTIFDKTKLRLEPRRPKTTTYGRNSPFQLDSINQNPTPLPPGEVVAPPCDGCGRPHHRSLTFITLVRKTVASRIILTIVK